MNVTHLSAECYPIAKVGGLGDVVGALPKYLNLDGINASVVLPYYDRKFVQENVFETVYQAAGMLGKRPFNFKILKEKTDKLGFELYLVYIPGLLDRPEVYCYPDEREQFIAYQIAFLDWILVCKTKPDVIHCHDHHTGQVPFLLSHSEKYKSLSNIPSVCTIHNGEYQGGMGWDKISYLPQIDLTKAGLLDWGGCINSLATSVKCCWKFTTVSPSYLEELSINSNGLEFLFQMEKTKGLGIINGIDTDVWNPETDSRIVKNYTSNNIEVGKKENKKLLCKEFGLSVKQPLLVFIGRLVGEKGADLLPSIISETLTHYSGKINILVLGSGEPVIEAQLTALLTKFKKQFNVLIGYNEDLSHRMYAGADFLIMPSRVEPCGLNQLYALRYGTMPIVNRTGGLKDTVIDIENPEGYGITFNGATLINACAAIKRAIDLYQKNNELSQIRKRMMALDFSWNKSAQQYINLYKSLIISKNVI